jgi:hypothetical protein
LIGARRSDPKSEPVDEPNRKLRNDVCFHSGGFFPIRQAVVGQSAKRTLRGAFPCKSRFLAQSRLATALLWGSMAPSPFSAIPT